MASKVPNGKQRPESIHAALLEVAQSRGALLAEVKPSVAIRVFLIRLLLVLYVAAFCAFCLFVIFTLPLPASVLLFSLFAAGVGYMTAVRGTARNRASSNIEDAGGFSFGSPTRAASQSKESFLTDIIRLRRILIHWIYGTRDDG
jgi:hypothetical protein